MTPMMVKLMEAQRSGLLRFNDHNLINNTSISSPPPFLITKKGVYFNSNFSFASTVCEVVLLWSPSCDYKLGWLDLYTKVQLKF